MDLREKFREGELEEVRRRADARGGFLINGLKNKKFISCFSKNYA